MDERDKFVQQLTPTVMVPRFGEFEPLEGNGHRFLVAADGLWLEVRRAWLYARRRIARQEAVAMPYGTLDPVIEFRCPPVSPTLVQAFSALARESCPHEAAGWIVWNETTGDFVFRKVETIDVSAARIAYHRPRLAEDEHLVMDWHSHGSGRAFFSGTDNRDDKGEVKVAAVLGHCDRERVSMAMRLCLLGTYIPLEAEVTAAGIKLREKIIMGESIREGRTWSTLSIPVF